MIVNRTLKVRSKEREKLMTTKELTVPDIGLIAATRGMLGAGIGFLLAEKFAPEERRAIGWTLVLAGAVTTFPLLMKVFGKVEGRSEVS